MSTISKLAKIVGLVSSMYCQAHGIPFSVESSMILEELLSMVGNSNSLLQEVSVKIDSIITSDFFVAEEHLRKALSGKLNQEQKQTALFSAKDLFMKSYYRMQQQPIGFLSAESAIYCGLIDFISGDVPDACVWLQRGADEFMSIHDSLKQPEDFFSKLNNHPVIGRLMAIFVIASLFSPLGWGYTAGVFITYIGGDKLSKNMPDHKALVEEFEAKKAEALQAKLEVLSLKATITEKFAV